MKTLLDLINRKEIVTTKINYVYKGVVQFTFLKLRYKDGKKQFPIMMRRLIERHKCESHRWNYFIDLATLGDEINAMSFAVEDDVDLEDSVNEYREAYLEDRLGEYMCGLSFHPVTNDKLLKLIFGESLNNKDTVYLVEANAHGFKLDTYIKGKREVVTFDTLLSREVLWDYIVDGSRVAVCHELKYREKIVARYENVLARINPVVDKQKAMRKAKNDIALLMANETDLEKDLMKIKSIIDNLGDLS